MSAKDWFTPEESLRLSALDIRTAPIYKLRGAQGDLFAELRRVDGDVEAEAHVWTKMEAIQAELDDRDLTCEIELEIEAEERRGAAGV